MTNDFGDIEFTPDPQQEQDRNAIEIALKTTKPFGLEIDVLYEAFNQIKSDPTITINQAIQNALWEWDC
jgi:hypothetical protein